MRITKTEYGTQLWLSANDTYSWAHKSNAKWPCSVLSGHRLYADFDRYGNLADFTIDGKCKDCPVDEFDAITSDFLNKENQKCQNQPKN